jgi:ribosomal protein S18 acetylase RimI-like enzyme
MNDTYQIEAVDNPEWSIIGGGISAYNQQQAGPDNGRNFCFVVKTPDGEVAGGIIGATFWNWLYIDLMWLKEELRGQGYGRQLLTLAEAEGRRRGATHAHLDTFSFQAPGFYQKQGYTVFGELKDFPPGHTRYYMVKEL